MTLDEYETIVPNAVVDGITFLTPNRHCAWRVQTIYTKEPDTIKWLKKMEPGDVLFDIGANMGQYSMLAASYGIKVHAFEPEAQNFALMVRNIEVNQYAHKITPWPLALSDAASFDILHLSGTIPGGSCHSFGTSKDFRGNDHQFPHSQGSCAITLDEFTDKYGFAQYIKIDVDGFEHLVMKGGLRAFAKAKSILIEINTKYPAHMEYVLPKMAELGFEYDAAQALESRRKEGPFEGVGNIIWYRDLK